MLIFSFIVFTLISISFGSPYTKCSVDDQECILKTLQAIKLQIADGISEMNIPRLDPLYVGDVHVDIPDVMSLDINGRLEGAANCIYDNSRFNIENRTLSLSVRCNLVGQGDYKAVIKKPILIGIPISNPLSCDGLFTASALNTRLLFDAHIEFTKDKVGVIRIAYLNGNTTYDYNLKGHKVIYSLTGIRNGNVDVSDMTNKALNKNWKLMSSIFLTAFIQKSVDLFIKPELTYLLHSPASQFFSDDLEQYVDRILT